MRLLCFSVQSFRRTSGSWWWVWIASDRHFCFRVWGWRADFRGRSWEKEESDETRSKGSSHGSSWELVALFSTLQVLVVSVAHSVFIFRWCRDDSGSIRKWRHFDWRGDWWAVEGASHCCYQKAGPVSWGQQHDVPEAVHSLGRSQELLEQAFDDVNFCVQMMRNSLILFHVDSKLLPHLCLLDHFVTNRADTVIPATRHQMVSLFHSVCEEEEAQLLSPLINS